MRSGFISLTSIQYAGSGGYWWAATCSPSDTGAHVLYFAGATIPSHGGNRYLGLPLRCLSTV